MYTAEETPTRMKLLSTFSLYCKVYNATTNVFQITYYFVVS